MQLSHGCGCMVQGGVPCKHHLGKQQSVQNQRLLPEVQHKTKAPICQHSRCHLQHLSGTVHVLLYSRLSTAQQRNFRHMRNQCPASLDTVTLRASAKDLDILAGPYQLACRPSAMQHSDPSTVTGPVPDPCTLCSQVKRCWPRVHSLCCQPLF